MPTKPKAPTALDEHGKALWADIVGKYELRADELRVLEAAGCEADLIDAMQAALSDQPLMIEGSQGQKVINPLVSELRQHRATFAGLLRQLKLPDENSTDVGAALSAKNRAAANARWARRGA
jgi:hypothetical protein